jgi:hypothetical protein
LEQHLTKRFVGLQVGFGDLEGLNGRATQHALSAVASLRATVDAQAAAYGDEKVANRDIRVWHGATENGP